MSNILLNLPPDYKTLCKDIEQLQKTYPFLRSGLIGHSLCHRRLYKLRLGRSLDPVLIAAGFHANEWLTTLVLLRLIDRVCDAAANKKLLCGIDVGGALARREVIFIPCVNPDGVEIALHGSGSAGKYSDSVKALSGGSFTDWSANARGVDINHNFNAGWRMSRELEIKSGITSPSKSRFGGQSPESEPETAALAKLVRERMPRTTVALHSQGEEIFYAYGGHTPKRGLHLARIFAASSGYKLTENSGLYSHAGFKDWVIEEFRRPAFTFELGKGKNPLPIESLNSVYAKVEEALVLAMIM